MKSVEQIARDVSNPDKLTAHNILEFYEVILGELQICASVKPASNMSNLSTETKEFALLEIEERLLDVAARVEMRGDVNLQTLITLWEKASCFKDVDDVRPTDRIAANIFRHLMIANTLRG